MENIKKVSSMREQLLDGGLSVAHVHAILSARTAVYKICHVPHVYRKLIEDINLKYSELKPTKAGEAHKLLLRMQASIGKLVCIVKTDTNTFRVIFKNPIVPHFTVVKIWVKGPFSDPVLDFGSIKVWRNIAIEDVMRRWSPKTKLVSPLTTARVVNLAFEVVFNHYVSLMSTFAPPDFNVFQMFLLDASLEYYDSPQGRI